MRNSLLCHRSGTIGLMAFIPGAGRRIASAILFAALASVAAPAAHSDTSLYDTKVYNPVSKSYFELVEAKPGDSMRGSTIPEISWQRAAENAQQMSYKNVRGRLAVVNTKQVSDFLLETFRPSRPAWIGLRYWCGLNRLQWVNGNIVKPGDYANWGLIWAHDGVHAPISRARKPTCPSQSAYWPIHYWSMQEGFTWNAAGQLKERYVYFVEYPTGRP